jgi:uncharacterized protein YigE (DUF2233 family)
MNLCVPIAVVVLLGTSLGTSLEALAGCVMRDVESETYTVCSFADGANLEVHNLDRDGVPFSNFSNLRDAMSAEGKTLVFAMNGGMFGEDLKPIGLYVHKGRQTRKINRRNGYGNFHLKPNGVFYLKGGKGFVVETEAYVRSGVKPDFATQSGPMLVVDGLIHPKFSETGASEKIRNGVGVQDNGTLVFVKSESPVNFHEFASLFAVDYACANALFFDGTISSLYSAELGRNDGFLPLGPMVAAFDWR